jgi:hypothetical protein
VFIQYPTRIFAAWLKGQGRFSRVQQDAYHCGRLAMALEIITQIKSLEGLPVVSELGRQEAIAGLHAVLVNNGLEEVAFEWYDYLSEWRKPTFEPDVWPPRNEPSLPGPNVGDAWPVVETQSVPALGESSDASGEARLRIDPVSAQGREPELDDV